MSRYAGELPKPLYRLHPAFGAVQAQPGEWIGPLHEKDAPPHRRALDADVEATLLKGWIGDVMRLVAARARRIYLDSPTGSASTTAAIAAVRETNVALMVQSVGARAVLHAHDGWDGVFLCGHDEEILERFGTPLDVSASYAEAVRPEDDFDVVDALAEERLRYGVGFGDNVRIRSTPETERAGYAGLEGNVFGETTPSEGLVDDIVGEPRTDYAVNVFFEEREEQAWFAPQLVEFVDHDPGSTFQLEGGPVYVRDEAGAWHERPRPGLLRRLFRRG